MDNSGIMQNANALCKLPTHFRQSKTYDFQYYFIKDLGIMQNANFFLGKVQNILLYVIVH
jgi:hypothetical protein